jgi:hypothetical protein
MLQSLFSPDTYQVVWAFTGGTTEAAYRVILGLGIIAAIQIALGLWMVKAGEGHRHHHH